MDASELAAIRACQQGQLQHFDALYTAHVEAVYRYLQRRTLVRAVAEDLTSAVFLKAMESIRSFSPSKGELRTWLYRIARNVLIDHYRSSAKRKTVDIETVWDLQSDEIASLGVERSIDAEKLRAAMSGLKPEHRDIVLLRVWEGLSYKEIAELTGKTENNAKVIFSRALADLRTKLPSLLFLLLFPHSL